MLLKEKLLRTGIFYDCPELDDYISLVSTNMSREPETAKTQKHHIIPVCYYKQQNINVDNTQDNLVNLLMSDHLRAHCYLLLCSNDKLFKANMFYAICFITGNNISTDEDVVKLLSEDLSIYQKAYEEGRLAAYDTNPMFNEEHKQAHDDKMRSEDVRLRIAASTKQRIIDGKLFNEEHRKNLSESSKIRCYVSKGDQVKRVLKTDAQKYVDEGWYCPYIVGYKNSYKSAKNKKYYNTNADALFKRGDKIVWVHNENQKKQIPEGLLEQYLSEGWVRGSGMKMTEEHKLKLYSEESRAKISNALKGNVPGNKGIPVKQETKEKLRNLYQGTKWMNNGTIAKQVPPQEIDEYLAKGFIFGRLPYDKKSKD